MNIPKQTGNRSEKLARPMRSRGCWGSPNVICGRWTRRAGALPIRLGRSVRWCVAELQAWLLAGIRIG